MKRGDLVLFTSPAIWGDDQPWLGTILEMVNDAHLRIFWHELNEIQLFNIGEPEWWEVINEDR